MSLKRFILDSLKTKFAGIDEKVLDRIAAKAVKTVNSEEEAKTFVEDTTLQQVIDSYTDSRVTEAQDSAIKSYEKKYGLSDGKPKDATPEPENKPEPEPEPEPDNGGGQGSKQSKDAPQPAYVKAILDGLKTLNTRMDAIENGRTETSRETQFNKLFEGASDKLKEQYKRQYKRMSFKDDEDFSAYLDEISEDVKTAISAEKGAVGAPKSGAKLGGVMNKYVQERVEARKAESAAPAISGLPVK